MRSSFAKGTRRVAEAIDFVAQSRTAPSSRQIIDRLAAPRSSGYDLLNGLIERQFLQRRAGGYWILGDEIHALAMSRFGLGRIAAEIPTVLTALQEQTQESAQLVVLNKSRVLVTHVYCSLRSIPLSPEIGSEVPVNWTAAGRLLVPDLPQRSLLRYGDQYIREVLEAKLRGYAMETEHSDPTIASIAAPVIGPNGSCAAAVGLILPIARMLNCLDTLVSLVQAAATKLTRGLSSEK